VGKIADGILRLVATPIDVILPQGNCCDVRRELYDNPYLIGGRTAVAASE
jgi:hypothetical protein